MGSTYSVAVESASNGTVFVRAAGSLKLITAAIKEGLAAIKDQDGDFSAHFSEVENVDGIETRQVARVTAEADVVALVLRKRLAGERKSDSGDAEVGETTEGDQVAEVA